jgi:two-component sensor histidine kinase
MDGDEVRDLLDEFAGRVETVAHVHRLLNTRQGDGAVDLGEYLREVAEGTVAALSSAGDNTLSVESDPWCHSDTDRAVSLGLIVAELVTNAIKYAHPSGVAGKIAVTCRQRADGTLAIDVSDDGVGLPEDIVPLGSNSFGFRLVRSLAERAKARIAFLGSDLGLRVSLDVPGAPRASPRP